jgi:hypothetical protein
MSALVINLFAGPGSGKSTMAAGLFFMLKSGGVNCELTGEYAKDLAWEEGGKKIADQIYVFAKQQRRVLRLADKVDVVISDSPTILGLAYMPDHYPQCFTDLVRWQYEQYNNLNVFVNRKKAFNPKGRFHTEEESRQKDVEIKELMAANKIEYISVDGDNVGLKELCWSIDFKRRLPFVEMSGIQQELDNFRWRQARSLADRIV